MILTEFAGAYTLALEFIHVSAPLVGKHFMECAEIKNANEEMKQIGSSHLYNIGGRLLAKYESAVKTNCYGN